MRNYGKKNFLARILKALFPEKRKGWIFINMAQGHVKQIKGMMSE